MPKFFTHDIFGFDGNAHSVYYRPVAMTWGLLMYLVTGGAPGWLHLSAILLHVTVMVLAYVFGRQLFGDERLAMLTAVLFGLHPSKVESVAWIGSSCVDGLGAVFFFASLIAFLKWRESAAARLAGGFRGSVCGRDVHQRDDGVHSHPDRGLSLVDIRRAAGRISRILADVGCRMGWCGSSTWRSGIR